MNLPIVFALFVTLIAACLNIPSNLRTPVPVRACVVRGSPWTTAGAQVSPAGQVSQMMDAVNAIWSQTNVAFIFLADPRVIDDPQPPGMKLDVPPYRAPGELGDTRLDDERGYGSEEGESLIEACNQAWQPGMALDAQPGFTVVFVREIVWTYGGPTDHRGYSTRLLTTYSSRDTELCERPYSVSKGDVAGRWSIIETYDRNYDGIPPNLANTVAHELGHDLLLTHGDGEDNDQNGRWDQYCDPNEANTVSSLMSDTKDFTLITPLQRNLAEIAAVAVVTTSSP